jgi:hypothetical protein
MVQRRKAGPLSDYLTITNVVEFEPELTGFMWSIPREATDRAIQKTGLEMAHFKVDFWGLQFPLKTATIAKELPIEGMTEPNFMDALGEIGRARFKEIAAQYQIALNHCYSVMAGRRYKRFAA